MYGLVEFFEPTYITAWLLKICMLYAASFFAVWVIAFIMSRIAWLTKGGIILRVYFAWIIPLTLLAVLSTIFLLVTATYYRELGISLWYCLAYLLIVFLSGIIGIDLSMKIRGRIRNYLEQ